MTRKVKVLSTLLVAAFIVAGCTILPTGRARPSVKQEATPTPIPTPIVPSKPVYKVQRGEVVRKLQFTGRVAPVQEKSIFFRTGGRVRHVNVKVDDPVKAGQVMADLENDNLERDLASAQLDLDRAQAKLQGAEADRAAAIKRAQVNLDIARQNVAITQAQSPAPRKVQAEVELEKAKLALKQAQAAYDAIAWRNDKGASAQAANLQQATLNANAAQAAYDLAMQSIATYAHQVTIANSQVELAQLDLDAVNRGVDPMLDNDVKRAQMAVTKIQSAITDAQLIAPFDGVVTEVSVYEGRAADAFKPVATVADPNAMEVRVDTSSTPSSELAEGMPATVVMVGRPGEEIGAKIRRLPNTGTVVSQDASEEDKSIRLTLDKGAKEAGYGMGDLARVTVVLERKADALYLPLQAVRTFEGRRFVVVQDGNAQRRVDVKVGIEGDDRVEILEGLTEGQTIIGQ